MLIVMRHGAPEDDIRRVAETIEEMGYQARPMPGKQRTTVGLVGNDGRVDASRLMALPSVQEVIHVTKPYKQVSREWKGCASMAKTSFGVRLRPESRQGPSGCKAVATRRWWLGSEPLPTTAVPRTRTSSSSESASNFRASEGESGSA